jgi:hypothetical protein
MSEIREAILEAQKKLEADTPETPQIEPTVTETPEPEVEPEKPKAERDESGKFKKKEEKSEVTHEPENEALPDAPETPNELEPEPEHQTEAIKPPRALAAHLKAKWSELPDEVRKEFARLEENSFKGVKALQQDAEIGKSLMAEIRPYEHLIKASGSTPEQAVKSLFQTAAILRTGTPYEKQRALLSVAQEYGIPLQGVEQPRYDPVVEQLTKLQQQMQQNQQQQEQQSESERVNAVNSFLEETDEKGNPKYPLDDSLAQQFFYEVSAVSEMNPNTNYRERLEKAYENLSWKVPEIRQVKLAQQQAALEAERKEKEAKALQQKKAGAVSIKGAPSTNASSSFDDLPLREQLKMQVYGEPKRI